MVRAPLQGCFPVHPASENTPLLKPAMRLGPMPGRPLGKSLECRHLELCCCLNSPVASAKSDQCFLAALAVLCQRYQKPRDIFAVVKHSKCSLLHGMEGQCPHAAGPQVCQDSLGSVYIGVRLRHPGTILARCFALKSYPYHRATQGMASHQPQERQEQGLCLIRLDAKLHMDACLLKLQRGAEH